MSSAWLNLHDMYICICLVFLIDGTRTPRADTVARSHPIDISGIQDASVVYSFVATAAINAFGFTLELIAFDVSANPGSYFEFMTDDGGSGANDDLRAFRPKIGYWFGQTGIEVDNYDSIPLP